MGSALGVCVGPSSLGSGLTALCGYNFYVNYKLYPKVEEKGRQGLALLVLVGPSLLGLRLAVPFPVWRWSFLLGCPFGSGLALLSWALGWPAFCGNNYNYKQKPKNMMVEDKKKGVAIRVGVGPWCRGRPFLPKVGVDNFVWL